MTEPTPAPAPAANGDEAGLPEPLITRSKRTRVSLVWLVPLLALVIGASLVVQSFLETGPRIEIEFRTAEGLEAGKTEVRYKEVAIGRVQKVRLSDDRQKVVVAVQLDRSAAGLAVADTGFWVVRPRIGAGGVSGLGTLLSGSYIGVDAGNSTERQTEFVGLEAPPYVLRGEPGAVFILRAVELGSLDVGSPVYYRRTRVGRVVGFTLDAHTDELTVKIFVEAPYQQLVTPQTRFWNAGGIDLSIDANGMSVRTQALASVLAGGIAFGLPAGAPKEAPAQAGNRFQLFRDRKTALAPPLGPALPVRMVFDGSVRGLSPGAPIDFLGIEIGSVRSISLQYDAVRKRFPVYVLADLHPLRLGAARSAVASQATDGAADRALLQRLVDSGLRAQVRSGNLLTGQLFIAMDFYPNAKPMRLEERDGLLTLPTVPGTLSELQSQVADIVQKLDRLPFDEIGRNLAATLGHAAATLKEISPEAKGLLADARRTMSAAQAALQQIGPEAQQSLAEIRRAVAGAQTALDHVDRDLLDPAAPMQRNVEQTLTEVQRAAQSLRLLADTLQRHPESLLRGKPADPALPEPGSSR